MKDVDGMKKLCGFPPAPIFMLLSEDGYTTVPENDSLGAVTQLMMNRLTGQLAGYLEFYEFFDETFQFVITMKYCGSPFIKIFLRNKRITFF